MRNRAERLRGDHRYGYGFARGLALVQAEDRGTEAVEYLGFSPSQLDGDL